MVFNLSLCVTSVVDFDSRITRNPESQTVSEGSSVSFFCLHGNSLPAANISWMFNNELITSTNYPEFTISTHSLSETRTSSTLFLSAAELTHSGTYTCRASNILLPSSSVESTAASLTVTGVCTSKVVRMCVSAKLRFRSCEHFSE